MPDILVPGGASAPELKAYLAVPPTGEGSWPAVVVVHEAFGLNDDTRQQADRLAAAGYLALGSASPQVVAAITALAAGAILTMVADTMIPEAFEQTQLYTGLVTTSGFLVAFTVSRLGG